MSNQHAAALPREPELAGLWGRLSAHFGRRSPDPEQTVALDIGTSKIAVLVARRDDDGELALEGFGSARSRGLKAGKVVNIEQTVESIHRAVSEAESMADCSIGGVNVSIASSHVRSLNAGGAIPVRESEITPAVVERVIDAASAVKLSDDQRILHVLPQEYAIDDQYGIRAPLGMSGVRLDAKVHLVLVGASAWHNLVRCVQRCGLRVEHLVLEQLASSNAVLMPDETDLGVCLIDIGGGTSDLAVHHRGGIRHTATIPIAGDHVNRDIAVACSTRVDDAEQIKIEHGSAAHAADGEDRVIEVPGLGGRPPAQLQSTVLVDIIRARYGELFELVNDELRRSGYYDCIEGAGLVLTGGGAMLDGLDQLAEEIFNRPVRVGGAHGVRCRDERFSKPLYATGIGLLTYRDEARPGPQPGVRGSWLRALREWI